MLEELQPHTPNPHKKDSNKTKQEESGIFYCANVYDIPYLHQHIFFLKSALL